MLWNLYHLGRRYSIRTAHRNHIERKRLRGLLALHSCLHLSWSARGCYGCGPRGHLESFRRLTISISPLVQIPLPHLDYNRLPRSSLYPIPERDEAGSSSWAGHHPWIPPQRALARYSACPAASSSNDRASRETKDRRSEQATRAASWCRCPATSSCSTRMTWWLKWHSRGWWVLCFLGHQTGRESLSWLDLGTSGWIDQTSTWEASCP